MRCGEFYCCGGVVHGMLVSGRNVLDRWVYYDFWVVEFLMKYFFFFDSMRHANLWGVG